MEHDDPRKQLGDRTAIFSIEYAPSLRNFRVQQ